MASMINKVSYFQRNIPRNFLKTEIPVKNNIWILGSFANISFFNSRQSFFHVIMSSSSVTQAAKDSEQDLYNW